MHTRCEQRVTFVSHGARLGVRANDPRVLERVRDTLPPGSRVEALDRVDASFSLSDREGSAGQGPSHQLYLDSDLIESSGELPGLLARLESELHFSVATHARSSVFIHAGVVGWRGRAILVPGRSQSGKSSLVAALLRAGAEYYSDEYAVVDADGHIRPYAKPLGIRGPDGAARKVDPRSFGCRIGTTPLRAGRIVSTRFSPGARFDPQEGSAVAALTCLIDNALVVRERPQFVLDKLVPVAREARMLEGDRGEADETAAALLRD